MAWGLFAVAGLCVLTGLFGGQPLGFSLAACVGCGGLTFLAAGATADTRGSHAWRMVLAWLVTTALAAVSFVPQAITNLTPTSLPNSWVLFAGFAAILFIAQRVTRGLNSVHTDLSSLLTELWVVSLATAFASFGSNNQPSVPAYFVALMIRLWSLGIAVEGLLRLTMAALSGTAVSETLSTQFLLRQLLLGDSSPPSNGTEQKSDTLRGEQLRRAKSGRSAIAAGLLLTFLGCWLLSGLVIVRTGDRAAYFRLGILQAETLPPGIHLTLPWPLSRTTSFAAQQLRATTVGYVADLRKVSTTPMLWTKAHGDAEFPLVVGDGTELVAINAIVHYRVADGRDDHANFVTTARDPDQLVRNLAQHVLMADTRTKTLQALLETDRTVWGQQIRSHLQGDVSNIKLGVEILQFDVLSIHPPIEVADSFLAIVTARVDAEREIAEARGAYLAERNRCEMMSATEAADASAAASVRLTGVKEESLFLEAMLSSYEQQPDVFRQRAFCNAISEALADRSLTLIDSNLPASLKLWLGGQREIHPEAAR